MKYSNEGGIKMTGKPFWNGFRDGLILLPLWRFLYATLLRCVLYLKTIAKGK